MSALSDRLELAAARKRDFSQADLARACKITSASVSGWFSGKTKSLSGQSARLAAAYFGCDRDWLADGIGLPGWTDGYTAREPEMAAPFSPRAGSGSGLDQALARLGKALANVPPDDREEVGDALRQWAKYGGRATYGQIVATLLSDPPSKRIATG